MTAFHKSGRSKITAPPPEAAPATRQNLCAEVLVPRLACVPSMTADRSRLSPVSPARRLVWMMAIRLRMGPARTRSPAA
jgi:hypothetical protein